MPRLAFSFLGVELFAVTIEGDEAGEFCSLDGGTTSAYPIGFAAAPYEHEAPEHTWQGDE